jgi:8-oxo-dGTP pyrophosphatase MutT (NUDIX family)
MTMDYILQLRQYVGHRPLLMVGAAVLVVDKNDRLLMLKRTDSCLWGMPGGSTEPGERVEEAAKRETMEEAGLQIGRMELFGVFSGPELYYKYPNGDEVYNVTIVYLSNDWHGDVVAINDEHTEFRWFGRGELPGPENISPPIIPVIQKFLVESS